jgi:hypothetical protein
VSGTGHEWDIAVAEICEGCTDGIHVLEKLKTVRRTICRTSHAQVLLFPSQKLMREPERDMTDEELITFCGRRAVEYETYFIDGNYDDRSLEDALKLYGSFYILEALPEKWSKHHMFKCNCAHCFQWASCHHGVLATMVCDPSIKCPTQYLETEIQARCKRGRPGGKKGDNSEGEGEGDARQFVKGPSTAMDEVRIKFCVYCARA